MLLRSTVTVLLDRLMSTSLVSDCVGVPDEVLKAYPCITDRLVALCNVLMSVAPSKFTLDVCLASFVARINAVSALALL